NPTTFRGTNGSQFFITDGQPRFLDFNHTIFGQLLRGWELLPQLRAVPRSTSDKPTQNVNVVSARVEPNFSDAIIIVSAIAEGISNITLTVEDGTSPPVTRIFVVTAFQDDRNSPPFLRPIEPVVTEKDKLVEVPLAAVDLERDFVFYANRVISGSGQSSGSGSPAAAVGTPGYTGLLTLGTSVSEYDMTYRGAIDGAPAGAEDMLPADIGVGDKELEAEALSFRAVPGDLLTGQIVATFADGDPRGNDSTTTATIRWGDGSTPATSTGVVARDTSRPGIARFNVTGSHTYQNPGVYPLTIDLQSNAGAKKSVRGQVVVTDGAVAAFGTEMNVDGKKMRNLVVATFTDLDPGRPNDYEAVIAWGDGDVSNGAVKRDKQGGFKVIGAHKYLDSKEFAIAVRTRKKGEAATETVAWSRVRVTGFSGGPHLPPFSFSHLIGQFGPTTDESSTVPKPLRETEGSQTFVVGEVVVLNSGDRKSPEGQIRFYLSADNRLNLTPREIENPNEPGQTIITPADRLVTIGGKSEGKIKDLKPGEGIRYVFDKSKKGDRRLRLPIGENGSSFNLLAVFDYDDPLARAMPISRTVVFGPFNGFVVKPTSLVVREADALEMTKTFTVKMDRAPEANVEVTLTASDSTQLEISPAKLIFTPFNFAVPHTVTVTAKDDNAADGVKSVRITLAPAVSDDLQWDGIKPDDVNVSVLDKAATP
ncbi:MAG: peptidylprolyl isomerase, partial [Chthoniobacteraceae bacterium]